MDYIIDIVGFHDSHDKLIAKEVSIVALNKEYFAHWMVTAPHAFSELPIKIQVQNSRLTSYHHGIEWFEGDIPHRQLHANLRELIRTARFIFVRGSQEAKLAQDITALSTENLEEYQCPSVYNLPNCSTFCCFHGSRHKEIYFCALNNAMKIKHWVGKNFASTSSLNVYHKNIEPKSLDHTASLQDLSKYSNKKKKCRQIRPPTPPLIPEDHAYENIENSGYYTSEVTLTPSYNSSRQYNEYSTDTSCTSVIKNTIIGCISCRQDLQGIDETGGVCY